MLRFLPSFKAVMYMKMLNLSPKEAAKKSLEDMKILYPNNDAAVVVLNQKGEFGAWGIGKYEQRFSYCVHNNSGLYVFNLQNQP
jgi:hypothetical protein